MSDEKKIHPLQRAWAGGVFDAKGLIPKTGYVVRLEHTDETLIRRFRDTFGHGTVMAHQKKDMARTLYIFQSTSADTTRTLLLAICPFLSPTKLSQAGEIVARIERSASWQKKHPEKVRILDQDPA